MNAAETGLLLLCCRLGDGLPPLTAGQFAALSARVRSGRAPDNPSRELTAADLEALGCGEALSDRILRLLDREALLEEKLRQWGSRGIGVVTWKSADYPPRLLEKLGDEAPPVLFLLGDRSLLTRPAVGLAGSRDLTDLGVRYAAAVGRMAAAKGFLLASGNARGADRTGQEACLAAGGAVVAFVPGRLTELFPRKGVLYVSEGGPDLDFTAERALGRNRLIHSLGPRTFVAQVREGCGGTWNGACRNLERGLSQLYVPEDGSHGAAALIALGAKPIALEQLLDAAANP